jgi:hypothetical protein
MTNDFGWSCSLYSMTKISVLRMSSSLRSYVNDFVRQKKFKGFPGQMISDTKRSGTRFFKAPQEPQKLLDDQRISTGADASGHPQKLRPASAGRSFFTTAISNPRSPESSEMHGH